MYIDKESTFFMKQDISKGTTSNIVQNGNGGDAYESCWLYALVNTALSGPATVTLNTGDAANKVTATVATYTLAKDAGSALAVRLPSGLKKFLSVSVSGATTGTITVAVAKDVQVQF